VSPLREEADAPPYSRPRSCGDLATEDGRRGSLQTLSADEAHRGTGGERSLASSPRARHLTAQRSRTTRVSRWLEHSCVIDEM
jgi:hypothetical protein